MIHRIKVDHFGSASTLRCFNLHVSLLSSTSDRNLDDAESSFERVRHVQSARFPDLLVLFVDECFGLAHVLFKVSLQADVDEICRATSTTSFSNEFTFRLDIKIISIHHFISFALLFTFAKGRRIGCLCFVVIAVECADQIIKVLPFNVSFEFGRKFGLKTDGGTF